MEKPEEEHPSRVRDRALLRKRLVFALRVAVAIGQRPDPGIFRHDALSGFGPHRRTAPQDGASLVLIGKSVSRRKPERLARVLLPKKKPARSRRT
jgi:hypothetical protein